MIQDIDFLIIYSLIIAYLFLKKIGSECEINIDDQVKASIISHFESGQPTNKDIFQEAEKNVRDMLKESILPPFYKTPMYLKALHRLSVSSLKDLMAQFHSNNSLQSDLASLSVKV